MTGISSITLLIGLFFLHGGDHMSVNVKQRFNKLLDENIALNSVSEIRIEVKQLRKHHVAKLLLLLILASVFTMLMSFMSSVIGYGDISRYMITTLVANMLSIWINNTIFIAFIKRVRNETYDGSELSYFAKKFLPQILCSILLSITQTLVLICLAQILVVIPSMLVFITIIVSIFFSLMNALVAFCIYDQKHKIKNIILGSFKLLAKHIRVIFFISLIFITWSCISNVFFNNLLLVHVQIPQGIHNIFHALLQQHAYMEILKTGGYYAMNYIVGGFLEVDVLLGLALLYQQHRKHMYDDVR